MKKSLILLILICGQLRLSNCKESNSEDLILYEVTPEFSKSIDKPEVNFKVQIPKSLKFDKPIPGKKTSSYGMIQKVEENGQVSEMYSFGYLSFDGMGSLDKEGIDFLKQVKSMLRSGGYILEDSKIGLIDFDGQAYTGLQLAGTMKEGISDLFVGRYYFNVIVTPNPNGNVHIMHLMAAKDNKINDYNDFANKLKISKLWDSFEYK